MNKNKKEPTDLGTNVQSGSLKPRNSLSLNPLMKKSHVHSKSTKSERTKNKQALKKEIQQRDQD